MTPDPAVDAEVRRIDEDRWLASRFAPAQARARLVAVYAVNHEIARTAEVVTQAAIGDIRLAWWREAIAEIHAGEAVRAHPALQAYAQAAAGLPGDLWDELIEARGRDLGAAPFAAWDEAAAYLDATAGNVMRLALAACGAAAPQAVVASAALAWGCTGLLRANRGWFDATALQTQAQRAHAQARVAVIAKEAFPALGYVALVPGYLRGLRAGRTETPLLARQLRLVATAATGRL